MKAGAHLMKKYICLFFFLPGSHFRRLAAQSISLQKKCHAEIVHRQKSVIPPGEMLERKAVILYSCLGEATELISNGMSIRYI